MNKIYTILVGILCLLSISTQARTVQEASAIASAFIEMHNDVAPAKRLQKAATATAVTTPVEWVFTQYQVDNTTPAVFVFNSTDEGFVLVSAEDNARAVLGYSDNGTFDANNIPANMQFWLQMYADELRRLGEEAIRREAKGDEEKKAIRREAKGERQETSTETYPTISPILGETIWGQGKPFNNKCPEINGEHAASGCVATALSQIMYVHKYPTKGTGSHSYTTETKQLNVSANFGNTTYDWANMIPDYTGVYTPTQADAVATLMYHVGVAADMDYTVEASGAVSSKALAALTKHFGYDKAITVLPKDFMKEGDLLQAIATDLQAGRPIYFSGATVNNEGHAFVCDGMQSDGYLHINWGWYGMADGYFALSALAPDMQGTGGSTSNLAFTERVTVYSNIKPETGGKALPLVTVNKLSRTSADTISKTTPVEFNMIGFYSQGIVDVAGMVTYFIYNNEGKEISREEVRSFELESGFYFFNPVAASQYLPNHLSNGEYQLEIRYIDAEGTDHPILIKGLGEVRIPFTVTSNQFVFGETPTAEVQLRPFTNADFSLVTGTKTWAVDLFSSQFWADAPSERDVLIRCDIHSNSETSVVGTYTMETGTIDAYGLYAEGYHNAYYPFTPTALHLTIRPAINEAVTIEYYMEVNGKVMQGSYTTIPDWYEKDGDTYYYKEDYNYDLATALPASKALELTSALNHTNTTEMSYFVEGTISNMRNTPEQIVQYKTARFDISDDGSTNNQFYCYNTKWLYNTDFVAGNEIKLGDEVVVLGQLQNYNGNTPEIKGYVYQHPAAQTPVDYSIKNLHVTTNQDTVFFNFESDAPYFHVKVTKEDGTKAAEGIIDFKNVYIVLEDGSYTLWIRPVDEAQEYYIGDAVEANFIIDTTTTAVEDITSGEMIYLYDMLGRVVDSKMSNDTRTFNVPQSGIYIMNGEKVMITK